MIKLILISSIIVGACVFALAISVIVKKDGKFPDKEIAHNKPLVKKGLMCARAEEKILWNKNKKKQNRTQEECAAEACADCGVTDCNITNN